MKQIVQDLNSGVTSLENLPIPLVKEGHLLIKTHRSLVSLGTEKMLVEFGKANFLDKARKQPEKVKQVLEKVKSDGLRPTAEAVFRKLGEPLPLGYSNAGEIISIGEGVLDFQIGDRVVSNGPHAEYVCIPQNLVARIPDEVTYEEASFTVVGAIALQGIRLLNPTFGETIVVTGLGLIGLITSQLLIANGCNVIGLDFDVNKLELAKSWGVNAIQVTSDNDIVSTVSNLTSGIGVDGVVITASASSNEIISQAAKMCRKRGRIVLVGVIGLDLKRSDFYEKELNFQVSCSYGPGRYDSEYELKGNDYPIAYVRWTEKRNFEAVLNAISTNRINVQSLITETVELEKFNSIYGNISNNNSIASILKYTSEIDEKGNNVILSNKSFTAEKGVIAIIGAGNYTRATVMPMLQKLKANIKYIMSANGLTGTTTAKKYGIPNSTTNYQDILDDPEVNAVIITTRHNNHASLVIQALKTDKHVFVEKPLALTFDDLSDIEKEYKLSNSSLTVGFNRRFSPFVQDIKSQLGTANNPINVVITMNAGFIPSDSWLQDMNIGGGRIVGEACHLVDLITYLVGSKVLKVVMNALGANPKENTDNATLLLNYENGSQGVINYFSNGSKAYSKERIEIFSQNRTAIIDNFRKSKYYGFKGNGISKSQDKGQYNQFNSFIRHLELVKESIIPFDEIMNTSKVVLCALESMKQGCWIDIE